MTPGTRADGLRLMQATAEFASLRVAGALAGVVILAAAGQNGTGSGRMIAGPAGIRWQAPGSSAPGPIVPAAADGSYLLEDSNPDKWVRVQVYKSYLPNSGEARVFFQDIYNGLGPTDVSAASALSGAVDTAQFILTNVSPVVVVSVKLWLDPSVSGLEVSSDGLSYFTPTSEADPNVIFWGSINPGGGVNLYIRRTIAAAAASSPAVLNLLRYAWNGI